MSRVLGGDCEYTTGNELCVCPVRVQSDIKLYKYVTGTFTHYRDPQLQVSTNFIYSSYLLTL